MSERAKFPCPRCGESVTVTELQLLNERRLEFGCACCGYDFTIDNPVPAAMERHFQAAKDKVRKPVSWTGADRRITQCV